MKKRVRTLITLVLAGVLLVGILGIVWQELESRQGEKDKEQAEQLAGVPPMASPAVPSPSAAPEKEEDPYAAELGKTDLAALQEINSEVIGWISIPNTELSYPLLQTDNNDFYLKRTWKKGYSSIGAIFLDYRNAGDLSDFNTLIYGHRMRNETMFGPLKHYKQADFLAKAPNIYLLVGDEVRRYDIFAAYEAKVDELVYTPGLTTAEEKEKVIRTALELSVVDSGITPTAEDRILTLVTCTGRGYASRWLISAVEHREE